MKMNKRFSSAIVVFAACFVFVSMKTKIVVNKNNKIYNKDLVPDTLTAIKIAEAIWLPIYGNKIYNQKPYKVIELNDSTWKVTGTKRKPSPGGVLEIEINKKDCKILKVSHGK